MIFFLCIKDKIKKIINKIKQSHNKGNTPSKIMVQLVCSKILRNLDNLSYVHKGQQLEINWRLDNITVAASARIADGVQNYYNVDGESVKSVKVYKGQFISWYIVPVIKFEGKTFPIDAKETNILWSALLKAGKLKSEIDASKAEHQKQLKALDNINTFFNQESEEVKRIKKLSEEAMAQLPPPIENPFRENSSNAEKRINMAASAGYVKPSKPAKKY